MFLFLFSIFCRHVWKMWKINCNSVWFYTVIADLELHVWHIAMRDIFNTNINSESLYIVVTFLAAAFTLSHWPVSGHLLRCAVATHALLLLHGAIARRLLTTSLGWRRLRRTVKRLAGWLTFGSERAESGRALSATAAALGAEWRRLRRALVAESRAREIVASARYVACDESKYCVFWCVHFKHQNTCSL